MNATYQHVISFPLGLFLSSIRLRGGGVRFSLYFHFLYITQCTSPKQEGFYPVKKRQYYDW